MRRGLSGSSGGSLAALSLTPPSPRGLLGEGAGASPLAAGFGLAFRSGSAASSQHAGGGRGQAPPAVLLPGSPTGDLMSAGGFSAAPTPAGAAAAPPVMPSIGHSPAPSRAAAAGQLPLPPFSPVPASAPLVPLTLATPRPSLVAGAGAGATVEDAIAASSMAAVQAVVAASVSAAKSVTDVADAEQLPSSSAWSRPSGFAATLRQAAAAAAVTGGAGTHGGGGTASASALPLQAAADAAAQVAAATAAAAEAMQAAADQAAAGRAAADGTGAARTAAEDAQPPSTNQQAYESPFSRAAQAAGEPTPHADLRAANGHISMLTPVASAASPVNSAVAGAPRAGLTAVNSVAAGGGRLGEHAGASGSPSHAPGPFQIANDHATIAAAGDAVQPRARTPAAASPFAAMVGSELDSARRDGAAEASPRVQQQEQQEQLQQQRQWQQDSQQSDMAELRRQQSSSLDILRSLKAGDEFWWVLCRLRPAGTRPRSCAAQHAHSTCPSTDHVAGRYSGRTWSRGWCASWAAGPTVGAGRRGLCVGGGVGGAGVRQPGSGTPGWVQRGSPIAAVCAVQARCTRASTTMLTWRSRS
jgi:hypothetical protein